MGALSLRPGRSRIPELSGIEFHGHESVKEYANAVRVLSRDMSSELEFASGELYHVLSRQSGHPLLLGLDVKVRARRVTKRLDRLARLFAGGSVEAVAFYMEFRRQFADVIRDKASKRDPRTFNWEG
jgi:hypothetical protein